MYRLSLWHRSVVVNTTTQLHSTKPELRFCAGSNSAYDMLEICDGEDLWQWSRLEIKLHTFCHSAIPQKQIIIIHHHHLQMCESLKKAKTLELRITLWHVAYIWLFHLFLCYIFFFSFRRFSERITWEIKTIYWKFSIHFIKKNKTNKINNFLFYLLHFYHFLIAF